MVSQNHPHPLWTKSKLKLHNFFFWKLPNPKSNFIRMVIQSVVLELSFIPGNILGQSVRKPRVYHCEWSLIEKFPRVLTEVPKENNEGPPRDGAKGKSRGGPSIQYSPEGLHEYLRNIPRGPIHHGKPKAFSQIFILTVYWNSSCARADTANTSVWQEASSRAERWARQMRFGPQ